MPESVIVAGRRTPIGKFMGALSSVPAPDLGAVAIKSALETAGIDTGDIEVVIMGAVMQAGLGPNPARLAAARAGIPLAAPASTVNKLCLSGLEAIAIADMMIQTGRHEVVVAGGMESMSRAPHLMENSRRGWRYGAGSVSDSIDRDAMTCGFDGVSMGAATERYQAAYGLTRQEQDEYAVRSHQQAAAARASGWFADEIVPVTAGATDVTEDEAIRPRASLATLARLQPAFSDNGTITAASSSHNSDGAAAVVVTSRDRAEREGWPVLARLGAYGSVGGPDPSLVTQPAGAIRDAVARDGNVKIDDLDLVEINESFAGVALCSMRELGLTLERVNVNGGSIALGHPMAMTGARLVLTLAHELRRRGGGLGVASICGGGGQGDAILLRV